MNTTEPISRIAFEIGPLTVYWYGVIIATAAFLGYLLAAREMKKQGLNKDHLADLLVWAIPIAILSARTYYVLFRWNYYSKNVGEIIAIWNGGIAIHGALIGAIITAVIFSKKRGLSFWQIADITAPSIILGQAIGRWGNFINQEAHGGPLSEQQVEIYYSVLPDFIMNQMYIEGVYYAPTFLYESIWNLLGLVVLISLRNLNLRKGELFLSYVIWYSFGRFFIEGMRTDSLMLTENIRMAQILSIALILFAFTIIWYRRKMSIAK